MEKWSVICAANDDEVLSSCLLASPGLRTASEVIVQKGFGNAADAYNDGTAKATNDLVVFAHQDVFLPDRWGEAVQTAITQLSAVDENWGVLGLWGPRSSGRGRAGFIYDGGQRRVLGTAFRGGIEVETLDEVVLILRKSTGLAFDRQIPGFHMYGADICLESRRKLRRCYAIAAFCIHNTNQYGMLPWSFWKAYLLMRRKWAADLPIQTTCTRITRWCTPMIRWNLVRAINLATGREEPPVRRVLDNKGLYTDILRSIGPACGGPG